MNGAPRAGGAGSILLVLVGVILGLGHFEAGLSLELSGCASSVDHGSCLMGASRCKECIPAYPG